MNGSRRAAGLILGLGALVGVAACGGGASDEGSTSGTVKVIVAPTVDVAPLYLAKEKGIFDKHGLVVEVSLSPTPGGRVPALISGAVDVAMVGTADVLQAVSAGVPLRFVGMTTVTTTNPEADTGKVYVAADSPIKSPADLNGKTVAVGALKGGGELSLRAALDKTGADSSKVKFVELPLDAMYPALKSGRVDAISEISPFTQVVEDQGARYLLSPGAEATANAVQTAVVSTEKYTSQNEKTLTEFLAALDEAVAYASDNPDEVRRILPTYSKTPADMAAKMTLPIFDSKLTTERVGVWADLMAEYKFIPAPVDVAAVVETSAS